MNQTSRNGAGFGTVRVGRWRNVVLAGIMPLALNVVTWPMALAQAPPATLLADPLQVFWYVMPLLGVYFLVWWVKMLARTARWGPLHFELTGDPPHPGGRVKGWIVTGAKGLPGAGGAAGGPECTVILRCILRRNIRSRSDKHRKKVLAEARETVAMELAVTPAGRQVRIPVDFGIPENAVTTSVMNERGDWTWWELVVESSAVRPALQAEIRIPVVHLAAATGTAPAGAGEGTPGANAVGADTAGVGASSATSTATAGTTGTEAEQLATAEPQELAARLEQERAAADPRSVGGRLFRSRDALFRMGTTAKGAVAAVAMRGDGAVRSVWSGLLLVVVIGTVVSGLLPGALVALVVLVIVRAALRPVLVRVTAAPDGLVVDTVTGRKVRTRN